MKKILYTVALLMLFSTASFAQRDVFLGSWEIAFPTNTDLLSKTSFSGGRVEYRHFLQNGSFSIGIAGSWNSFDQYTAKQTYEYETGNGAVTTDLIKHIYSTPITLTGHYYFKLSSNMFKPYVGVGLGAQYSEQNLFFNIYEVDNSDWGFVVRPEAGVLVRFAPSFGGFVSCAYNYATNDAYKADHLEHIAVNIGFAMFLQ